MTTSDFHWQGNENTDTPKAADAERVLKILGEMEENGEFSGLSDDEKDIEKQKLGMQILQNLSTAPCRRITGWTATMDDFKIEFDTTGAPETITGTITTADATKGIHRQEIKVTRRQAVNFGRLLKEHLQKTLKCPKCGEQGHHELHSERRPPESDIYICRKCGWKTDAFGQ